MNLYDWLTFLKADLQYTWRFHKSSFTVFLIGTLQGLLLIGVGILAYRADAVIPIKDLQLISIIAVGVAGISIQWHYSNMMQRSEEKDVIP